MATTQSPDRICANCQQPAKSTCQNCRLILYCGRECQVAHRTVHKSVCRSSLIKSSWQPTWWRESRDRALYQPVRGEIAKRKYLWGNVPAIDVLNLKKNEGEDYQGDLRILFAASGDLRTVIKTIVELPTGYSGKLKLVVNDKTFEVAARNAIMLLVALTTPETEAISCIIHLWYSACITQTHANILTERVRPMIEAAIEEIKDEDADTILTKTFTSGTRAVRLTFEKSEWSALRSVCTIRPDLSMEQANEIRTANTLCMSTLDNRESKMIFFTGPHRVSETRFKEDGMLLPYSHSRAEYTIPNPTFFQTNEWPLASDFAHPNAGWNLADLLKSDAGPAVNDLYGKMFCYLKSILSSFLRRSSTLNLEMEVYCIDVKELPELIQGQTFDRIETSNIADHIYVGLPNTIDSLGPLLKKTSVNKHATLITLFMNAMGQLHAGNAPLLTRLGIRRAGEYLGIEPHQWPASASINHPTLVMANEIALSVIDADFWFKEYQKYDVFGFAKAKGLHGLEMKRSNTVIEKWPLRLKKRMGQPGAKEEFDLYCAGGSDGMLRYAEWHRL